MLRRWSCHRITVAAATPNRTAAAPATHALVNRGSARERRSIDNGLPIHAGLHPANTVNQISAFL